jgi:hypothetical protein
MPSMRRVQRQSDYVLDGVRREMLERGFTLLETPRFFELGLRFRPEGRTTVLAIGSKRWRTIPELARYAAWLETLLKRALPDERLALTVLEFRHEPAGYEDKTVDRLHADGSYIRSVCTLYGQPTIYRDGKLEQPVPPGQALLMTAMQRAQLLGVHCTLHRRPGPGPERAVIVCSFEPCRKDPHSREFDRRAAPEPRGSLRSCKHA